MKYLNNTVISVLFGVLVSIYLYFINAGWKLPLSDKMGFILFVIVGMAMCSVGIGHSLTNMGFNNPLVIFGMGFGVLNLFIVYIALTGGSLFFENDYASATMALGGSMIFKVLVKIIMNGIYA